MDSDEPCLRARPTNARDAETYTGVANTGRTLPIMLRDDPWNKYEYVSSGNYYNFHWNWLQCCTDGMILGPMPSSTTPHAITYEGRCAQMKGLESGTRISMWNPYGPAYNSAGTGMPTGCGVTGVTAHGIQQLDPLRRSDGPLVRGYAGHPDRSQGVR